MRLTDILGLALALGACGDEACPSTCGLNGQDDCCRIVTVAGGTFYRDYDVGSDGLHADMSHAATVSTFRLEKYEVTVGRFREFVEAGEGTSARPPAPGAGAHPRIADSGWDMLWDAFLPPDTAALTDGLSCNDDPRATWTSASGSNESAPINCVSWYDAMAFCIWDGGFLPTAAEWNYAAAGGDEQRAYPWSQPPASLDVSCADARYKDSTLECFDGRLIRVGSTPAGDGRWGNSDLASGVKEWVLDWLAIQMPLYIEPCTDCAKLVPDVAGSSRTLKGGNFKDADVYLRVPDPRDGLTPEDVNYGVGFRCAHPAGS